MGRGEKRARYVTPYLSYYREGAREHESSARIINGMKNRIDVYRVPAIMRSTRYRYVGSLLVFPFFTDFSCCSFKLRPHCRLERVFPSNYARTAD